MATLDKQIALQVQVMDLRRQVMRHHKEQLRTGALAYCRKPSTLAAAALSGFLIGRLSPPITAMGGPIIKHQFAKILPLLVLQNLGDLLDRPRPGA